MLDTTAALFAYLKDISAVQAVLSSHEGLAAIFEERAPNGYEINSPVVIIDPPIAAPRSDTSTNVIRTVDQRLRLFGRTHTANGATGLSALTDAAETLAAVLHNARPPITGGSTMRLSVDGPSLAPTEDPSLGGRVISIRWKIQET